MKKIYVLGKTSTSMNLEYIPFEEVISAGVFTSPENGEPLAISLVLENGDYVIADPCMLEEAIWRFDRKTQEFQGTDLETLMENAGEGEV